MCRLPFPTAQKIKIVVGTTRGNDGLQDAFCFPEEPRVVRKPDDDEAPIIPEKYLNVSPAYV